MKQRLEGIYRLGIKELLSLRYDRSMMILIIYAFTYAVYAPARGARVELFNASAAIVDEDQSRLSRAIGAALQRPFFNPPTRLSSGAIDRSIDRGDFTFIIHIPPYFEANLLRQREPTLQLLVDATAMSIAGSGASYLQAVIHQEILRHLQGNLVAPTSEIVLVPRAKFNPNLQSSWFLGIMQIINNITLLAIFLCGAALIRDREHGTVEHLLVMPLRPADIMLAKVWANGLVVVVAATLSLRLVVNLLLEVPIAGSVSLFVFGEVVYLFSVASLGIMLATLARSMPQFALLALPVFMVMNLLSGGTTPLDSMPRLLQYFMMLSPTTHFVLYSQAILFRGAGLSLVLNELGAMAGLGFAFFLVALVRFRQTISAMHT